MTAAWDQRDAAEQAHVRDGLLAGWLPLVVAAAPHWREVARRLDLAPDRLRRLTDLQALPAVTERDLRGDDGSGADLVIAPTEAQVKAHAPTSLLGRLAASIGGGGAIDECGVLLREYRPLQLQRAGVDGGFWVASSRSDLDRMHRAGARTAAVLGLVDDDVVVSAVRNGPDLVHLGTSHLAMGASLTAVHPRSGDEFDDVVAGVRALQPSVLVVAADDAEALGEALVASSRAHAVRRVVVLGPPLDDATRERLGALFGVADGAAGVLVAWAPPESRLLWAECAPGNGLHTFPDLELLEVVDPLTAEPVPADSDGELVLTSLGWHGTALLRFRTGVRVDGLATDPCPACGRTLPRLVGVAEPSAWQLAYDANGTARTVDLRGIASVLTRTPGAVDWRVELVASGGGDHLRVEVAGDVTDDVHDLQHRLADACGMVPEVVLDVPAEEVAAGVARVGGIFADLRSPR